MSAARVEGFILGFAAGVLAFGALLGLAIAEVERGRSLDAWLRVLALRSWPLEKH